MDPTYASTYADLASRHWWWLARRAAVVKHIERIAGGRRLRRILDVGCGDGSLLTVLNDFGDAYGVEPDPHVISPENPSRDRIRIAPFGPDFEDENEYDLVLMLDVLEHIEDDQGTARRLRGLIRPGGHAIITVPALPVLWSMHDVANRHFRRYTRSTLRAVLQGAGFEIRSLGYLFGWTVAPLILRRLIARPTASEASREAYHVSIPPRVVNNLLYGLCRLEQSSVGRLGLPLGSSLVAVAHRPEPDE